MKTFFELTLVSSVIIFASVIIVAPRFATQTKPTVSQTVTTSPSDSPLGNYQGCSAESFTGRPSTDSLAYFEGQRIGALALSESDLDRQVLSVASEERWIEVDLSDQMLYAWEGDDLFLSTKVSTGLPHTPTPIGEFKIWIKLAATKMEGGEGEYYYYLPNVPYVMFFENDQVPGFKGYGLHGTYWHNDFGTPRSHGCVNLPTNIAKELFYWTNPVLKDKYSATVTEREGTRIVIHE